jgi:hypothetical protein
MKYKKKLFAILATLAIAAIKIALEHIEGK